MPRKPGTFALIITFALILNLPLVLAQRVDPYISVPHHFQITNFYCGPASLEMFFDFYGPDIPQPEIAHVARTSPAGGTFTDDMRRAAQFSNLSTSVGDQATGSVTGYSTRKLGYAAFEHWGFSLDELKSLIDVGYPIIVCTWLTEAKTLGHYRVVVGYDETHVTLQDPWFGPTLKMTNSKFLDLWEYSYFWGLFVSPWDVSISAPPIVREENTFSVTATVTYPCPTPFSTYDYPVSLSNATIVLPAGLSLTPGETAKKTIDTGDLAAGNSAIVTWAVQAESLGAHTISVEAEGKVVGSVGTHDYYSYKDRIGGFAEYNVTVKSTEAFAHLVRRKAWPEHHRFVLSKDGDTAIDDRHRTPGNQTLYGTVTNPGSVTIPAGMYKVVWTITDSVSSSIHTVETVGTVDLKRGDIKVLTYDLPATDLIHREYYVETWGYCYGLEGEKPKTFSFTVVP